MIGSNPIQFSFPHTYQRSMVAPSESTALVRTALVAPAGMVPAQTKFMAWPQLTSTESELASTRPGLSPIIPEQTAVGPGDCCLSESAGQPLTASDAVGN